MKMRFGRPIQPNSAETPRPQHQAPLPKVPTCSESSGTRVPEFSSILKTEKRSAETKSSQSPKNIDENSGNSFQFSVTIGSIFSCNHI